MKSMLGAIVGILLVPLLVIIFVVALLPSPKAEASCVSVKDAPGVQANVSGLPGGNVAGYEGEQLKNAALIVNAGKALDLPLYGQQVGVMTAMGESGLRVIDKGDAAGPDSRGLFQQRAAGWGSYGDRMDPTISSTNFFKAMAKVTGWESLTPTEAAHRTQRNADPNHYTKYWDAALKVVDAVSGAKGGSGSVDVGDRCNAGPISGGSTTGKDDYPWKDKGSWNHVGTASATNADTRFFYKECVDFAFWRLMQQTGNADVRPLPFNNFTFVPGRALGDAVQWHDTWLAKGWPVDNTPEVGAIAWFGPNLNLPEISTGAAGHVGVVMTVNPDGTVVVEEYNGQAAPRDHVYGHRMLKASLVTNYLHIPASAKKAA